MSVEKKKCPICNEQDALIVDNDHDVRVVECPLCGHYNLSWVREKIPPSVPKHILSGVTRNVWDILGYNFDLTSVTTESMVALRKSSPIPIPNSTDISAKADLILKYYARKYNIPGIFFNPNHATEFSVGFCSNRDEFKLCFDYLISSNYIELIIEGPKEWPSYWHRITPTGWAYLSGIGADAKEQGFIAMAFRLATSDELHTAGLNVGITNAGYHPLRIDRKDHNNRIDDEIVAEIRKSKFVVADLTGKNAGSYFEAGFAMGLGKPVIWTCQQSEIDAGNVHFDTRQYSIVPWEPNNLADFAKRLTQRIEATIGHGNYSVSNIHQ
jgi:Zn ribbon nucleic-acid-binding protein